MSKENIYTIYTTVFKLFGLQQIVNANNLKTFGFNKYILIHIFLLTFLITFTIIGMSGYIYDFERPKNKFNVTHFNVEFVFILNCIINALFKMIIIFLNRNKILKLLTITYNTFLLSKHCKENYNNVKFGKHHNKSFIIYLFVLTASMVAWIALPFLLNTTHYFGKQPQTHIRELIILNFKYPINNETYNSYYKIIFFVESIITIYTIYSLMLFDIFVFTILQLIADYYKVVSCAFEHFKFKNKNGIVLANEKINYSFLSIYSDFQCISKQLEILYEVAWPVVMTQIVGDAIGMISIPYIIVRNFQNNQLYFDPNIFKFLFTLFAALMQSYMYCSLFQFAKESKYAVNIGLYRSNWTGLDVPMKKLIFHMMFSNSSNYSKAQITPNKYIDLPLYATVVRASYSVTSVMIKSNS